MTNPAQAHAAASPFAPTVKLPIKTVTQRWFDDSTSSVGVNTTIALK
ncbi:hypothetical protein [Noviherbaspirillum sedimenti]|nr:hypothetical protein [Noviherbaspirillum sedimenti]